MRGSALHQSFVFIASKNKSVEVPSIRALLDQNLSILSEKFNHSKKRFITPLTVGRSIVSPAIVISSHSHKEGMGNTANTVIYNQIQLAEL